MNRLGAILTGEADPPVYSLYVYNANPVASTPNVGKIVAFVPFVLIGYVLLCVAGAVGLANVVPMWAGFLIVGWLRLNVTLSALA